MSRSIRLVLAAAVLPLAGATVAAVTSPAGAAGRAAIPALESCRGARLVRPTGSVVLTCADANAEIRATRWTSWGPVEAAGRTDFAVNLCTPTCVASRMRLFRGSTIALLDPRRTGRGPLFTRAVITYTLNGATRTYTAFPPS